MYDVVTIGETMLRFTPPHGLRWEQAESLQVHIGGSESNTAVGLARLGHRVAWVSRLTDNPFGRKIANSIAYHGVDTQHIVWTDQDRIGTYFYEQASAPRGNQVLYDRAGSSFSRFGPTELPGGLFQASNSRFLHITGISLGLGQPCIDLIHEAARLSRDAGWKISFDVNYRAKLWSAKQAAQVCSTMLEIADVIFLPIRDAKLLWNIDYDSAGLEFAPADVAQQVARSMNDKLKRDCCFVMTMGSLGSCCLCQDLFTFAATEAVPAVGRLGGGDAFTAGFLSGLLQGEQPSQALRWGNAAARVKYSIPGDMPFFQASEVARLVLGQQDQQPFR